MRTIKDEIKNSLTYRYHGKESDENYYDWAEKLWNSGYNMSVKEVAEKLGISTSWITKSWFTEIRHVNYSNKFIYKKTGKQEGLTRLSWEEVLEFVIDSSTFEVQTEFIDLYSYLLCDKKFANEILKEYKEKFKSDFYNPGTIPESILNKIDDHYLTNLKLKNLSPVSYKIGAGRKAVPWVPIKKFDFIGSDRLYTVKGTTETVYREAFLRGDIKIKLGNKKTWFYKNNVDPTKMNMPFLIPYGKEIKIYAR